MQTTLIAKVASDRDDDTFYSVSKTDNGDICNCPHFVYRHKRCKHIERTRLALKGYDVSGVLLVRDYNP